MSRINFAAMAAEKPEYSQVWQHLASWFATHPRIQFIDVRRLSHELPTLDHFDLALALQALEDRGFVRRVFRVVTPDGLVLDRNFASPSEVPERMPGRFHDHWFDTSEGDIISGFLVEEASVPR